MRKISLPGLHIIQNIASSRLNNILRILLLMLFVSYTCSITFFAHTHIVNGVTIVHSHPYKKNSNGTPDHEHTGTEIQLIKTLSAYSTTLLIVLSIVLGIFLTKCSIIPQKIYTFIFQKFVQGRSTLRPPPLPIV